MLLRIIRYVYYEYFILVCVLPFYFTLESAWCVV